MAMKAAPPFDPKTLLSKVGDGRSIGKYRLSKQEARILQRLGGSGALAVERFADPCSEAALRAFCCRRRTRPDCAVEGTDRPVPS